MNGNDSFLLLALFYANHEKKQSNPDNNSIDLQQHPNPIVNAIAKLSEELDQVRRHAGYYKHPDGFAMREIRKAETLLITGLYISGQAEEYDPVPIAVRNRLMAVYKMGLDMDLFDRDMIKQRFAERFTHIFSDAIEHDTPESNMFMEEMKTLYIEEDYLSMVWAMFGHAAEAFVQVQLLTDQGLILE